MVPAGIPPAPGRHLTLLRSGRRATRRYSGAMVEDAAAVEPNDPAGEGLEPAGPVAGATSAVRIWQRSRAVGRVLGSVVAWVLRHPLVAGWLWVGIWALLLVLDEFLDRAGWAWYAFVILAALPTLLATLALLAATPRQHLKPATESVLSHFFVRFLALIGAFLVWGVSVVLSASISTAISAAGESDDRQVTALGFHLLLASIPLVITVLWLALIIRCAWFLRRLRGWRQRPSRSRVPVDFLHAHQALRSVVIGLAHPGLLLVAGLGTSVLALLLDAVDVTLNVVTPR